MPVFSNQSLQPSSNHQGDATQLDSAYCILHSIPGRMRIRVPGIQLDMDKGDRLESALEQIPGVYAIRINYMAQSIVIHYQSTSAVLIRTCLDNLFAAPDFTLDPAASDLRQSDRPTPVHDSEHGDLRRAGLTAAVALVSQMPQFRWVRPIALVLLTSSIFPIARRAFDSIWCDRRLNIDCLDFLSISLSAWQGKLVTPALVIVLHELGDTIRDRTARMTETQSATLADALGRFAWVKVDGDDAVLHQVPSDQVHMGNIVVVHPGEQIPVDGTVLEGEATVDQQGLTGEAMPIVARPEHYVFASTLVRSGQLTIRAERVADQTRAAAGLRLLQQAPVYDTRMANYTAKVADRLIVPSLCMATLVLLLTRSPDRAASILTLDFVTGIRVSIPTAFLGALNHTTRHGVLVRSGRTLEQLAEVDTIVFDKTGTLTQGRIAIAAVTPIAPDTPPERLLQLVASAEQRLTHPVAEAIVQQAQAQQIDLLPREDWHYTIGMGVTAEIDGHQIMVGSKRFLQQSEVIWHGADEDLTGDRSLSYIYAACDGQLLGTIGYTDPLRPESTRLINLLQRQFGLELHLLTGDNPERAAQVARDLGILPQHVYSEAFPDQKANIVRDLHRSGRTVAFVGDGLNDSVALAYADVSVSFERGADIARETADVVLMNNNLLELIEAIAIARETRNLIEQNVALVVLPNLIALGLATVRGMNPLLATTIHNGSAIAAGMNSLRPLVTHTFAPNVVIN
jgi:Cu2+-exporting ATPase